MSPENFFGKKLDQSAVKHRVLEHYLHMWVSKLGRFYPDLVFVDGFAGAGRYDDGSDGSPAIAAQWNNKALLQDRGVTLHVHACESDAETFGRLRQTLSPWPSAHAYHGEFADMLPALLKLPREWPAFWFLDPFGMKPLAVERLRPVLEASRERFEVLLRLDHKWMQRFSGWAVDKERSGRNQKLAASFRTELARMVAASDGETEEFTSWARLMDQYIGAFEVAFAYVQLLPIRPRAGAEPAYYLLFCTNSAHGVVKMSDAFVAVDDAQYREQWERAQQGQGNLFDAPNRPGTPPELAIENVLRTYLDGARATGTWIEIMELFAFACDWFGPSVSSVTYRRIVRQLEDRGLVEIQRPPGKGQTDRWRIRNVTPTR